eukprot:CAMPEP_0178423274 /NCGR_PEP_ID=MMETSP0689_2-20121128/27603_1 /TAXON_ID=160604 /ORGANISM="Amphidinium massartii, Strain CS-259" /LENGTH=121 /DNA_ID=CAMNT_0020044861 /DNA_START=1315 /DNA_END=1681 /DNA_ORIENTATION=-
MACVPVRAGSSPFQENLVDSISTSDDMQSLGPHGDKLKPHALQFGWHVHALSGSLKPLPKQPPDMMTDMQLPPPSLHKRSGGLLPSGHFKQLLAPNGFSLKPQALHEGWHSQSSIFVLLLS